MIALSRTCNKIITSSSNFSFCAVLSSQFSRASIGRAERYSVGEDRD